MRKIVVLITLLLTGCQFIPNRKDFSKLFNKVDKTEIRQNNFTDYFSYYLPHDIEEYESDELSFSCSYNNSYLICNVNVSSIVSSSLYNNYNLEIEDFFDSKYLISSFSGQYYNHSNDVLNFLCNIYQYNDQFITVFKSHDVLIYGLSNDSDLYDICSKILLIAQGFSVDKEKIIAAYSTKDTIDYEKQALKLFDTKMPEKGVIDDLITSKDENIE